MQTLGWQNSEVHTQVSPDFFTSSLDHIHINQARFVALKEWLQSSIVWQQGLMHALFVALLVAKWHVLIEWVPGLAKTKTVMTLADLLHVSCKRIQCTPDMMPWDITWIEIFDMKEQRFSFVHGPVFASFVLADEINRTTPKVQSALLEAMEEWQVTVWEHSYSLPAPFFVIATQNPLEQEWTFALPEAQLDRFLLKIQLTYPSIDDEKRMLQIMDRNMSVSHVLSWEDIVRMQSEVREVTMSQVMRDYVVSLVAATRNSTLLTYGGSPRATLALSMCAKAIAWLAWRSYVIHTDVQCVALSVLRHRVHLSYTARAKGYQIDDVLVDILKNVSML